MKKLLFLLFSVLMIVPGNGTTHIAHGAAMPVPAVAISANLHDISFTFWDRYQTGIDQDSVRFDTDSSWSETYVDISSDNLPVDRDWESNFDGSNASASLNGGGYNLNASASSLFNLAVSLDASAGNSFASATRQMTFESSKKGVMIISFSYDLTATLSNFNENGETDAYLAISVSNDTGTIGPQIQGVQNDSTGIRMTEFWDELDIQTSAQNGEWNAGKKTGELFFGLEADCTYSLFADVLVYAHTAEPLQTPIPGAAWLLGSGIVGLIGFRRNTENQQHKD